MNTRSGDLPKKDQEEIASNNITVNNNQNHHRFAVDFCKGGKARKNSSRPPLVAKRKQRSQTLRHQHEPIPV